MFELLEVIDAGADVLLVRARNVESGEELAATGWVSATTNHYDAAAYDADGNLAPDAKPRPMSAEEIGEYALGLLGIAETEPAPISFEIPAGLADVARKAAAEEEVKP